MKVENEYKRKLRRRKKERAIQLLGGKCQLCGYEKCMGSLDFHHTSDKEDELARMWSRPWKMIEVELKKCILLCANCHRELHYIPDNDIQLKNLRRIWVKKTCPICQRLYDTTVDDQVYCSNACRSFSRRKSVRPSKDEMMKMITEDGLSWTKIAKMCNVTEGAVRKWARRYNICKSSSVGIEQSLPKR